MNRRNFLKSSAALLAAAQLSMANSITTPLTMRLPKPLPHQLPILLDPHRFKVVVCGRRWGKTATGLQTVLRGHGPKRGTMRGAIDGGNIWWVVPEFPLGGRPIWRDLKKACAGVWTDKSEQEHRIELPGGGSVTVRSADDPDSLRSEGLDGVVMDEAAMMKEDAWREALRPALADKKGWAMFIGTPKGMNWYYELFQYAGTDDRWACWQRPSSDNPLMTPEEIADLTHDMGSIRKLQEIEAQFVAGGGLKFKPEWFPIVPGFPKGSKVCRYWDKAGTEDGGDYSAGVLMVMHEGICYVADARRGQWSSLVRNQIIMQTAELDAQQFGRAGFSVVVEQEPGSSGKESAEFTIRQLAGFNCSADKVTGNKELRSDPFAAYAEAGNVRLVAGPWNKEYLDELAAFPLGRYDDQVDASGGAFNKITSKRRFAVGVG